MTLSYSKRTWLANTLTFSGTACIGLISLANIQADPTFGFFFCVLSLVTLMAALLWQDYGELNKKTEASYSRNSHITDVAKVTGLYLALYMGTFLFLDLKYGETEKPIEQLNGIYLGETYTLSDLERKGMKVTEGDEDDEYAFHLIDKEKPTMHTYVFVNDTRKVKAVKLVYQDLEAANASDLRSKIEDITLQTYGGKPSVRNAHLYDGNNTLVVWVNDNNVGITLRAAPEKADTDTLAKREALSVELRTMDAIGAN